MKAGRVVILLAGRRAGKKAVIVKQFDEGKKGKMFPHALVAGVERAPMKVAKKMSKKKLNSVWKGILMMLLKVLCLCALKVRLGQMNTPIKFLMPFVYKRACKRSSIISRTLACLLYTSPSPRD